MAEWLVLAEDSGRQRRHRAGMHTKPLPTCLRAQDTVDIHGIRPLADERIAFLAGRKP